MEDKNNIELTNIENNTTKKTTNNEIITTLSFKTKILNLITIQNVKNLFLFCGAWFLIWCFLIMLSLMGNGFKLLGMKDSSRMFDIVDNPISALMIGILVTVLVQSSSTSTSIIIGLVGADELSVNNAIPMIMGANIGTSVTNTIVSLSSYTNKENYRRAFAGATVHDLFNFLTVIVLLPIQWATNFLGLITWEFAKNEVPCEGDCKKWEGPIKKIVKPTVSKIIQLDKKISKYIYQNYCEGYCDYDCTTDEQKLITEQLCNNLNYNDCDELPFYKKSWESEDLLKCKRFPQYMNVDRLNNDISIQYLYECPNNLDCSNNFIWNSTKTNLTSGLYDVCSNDWISKPCDKPLLKGGLLYDWEMSDYGAGILSVSFSIFSLCVCIYLLIKLLNFLLRGRARKWLVKAIAFNEYFSIIIGALVTILVQSSSITTSTLVPLCAINVITLEQMFPLTLGANIGTTVTGLLAASVAVSNPAEALQVALAHLLFNIFGILIWFPHPKMRKVPLNGARKLGEYCNINKFFPFIYTGVVFFAIPGIAYGITYAVSQ
jgi:sodium-dependent phosphate cotransporter